MASAQEYAQITELSRRVSEWEERVLPKLEEEVSHLVIIYIILQSLLIVIDYLEKTQIFNQRLK